MSRRDAGKLAAEGESGWLLQVPKYAVANTLPFIYEWSLSQSASPGNLDMGLQTSRLHLKEGFP